MKILIIHNQYRQQGGEEAVVAFQQKLLEENGHQLYLYIRDYNEMNHWWTRRVGGVFSALYNPRSIRDLRKIINVFKPEVALLHNLYPIISPAIIPFLKKKNIRTIQILHNYRLFCPIGSFYTNGQICEKCTGKGREWHCFLNRCNGDSYFQSLSYTLRNVVARKFKYFDAVDQFIALSDFQKKIFLKYGFDNSKIAVIPNSFFPKTVKTVDFQHREYIGFVGRLTPEKGIFDFIQLAKLMPDYKFRVAGKQTALLDKIDLPNNIEFKGFLDASQLSDFYCNAKVIIFPSRWYEGFPMTLLEAFSCHTPIIVYNLSTMPEIVEDEKEGFVVEIGDITQMSEKIKLLFNEAELWKSISDNTNQKFTQKYSVQSYYQNLMTLLKNNVENEYK